MEQVGRPWSPSVASDTEIARAHAEIRNNPPVARCHPERPMYAVGLCQHCYAEVQRHSRRTAATYDAGRPMEGTPLSARELEIVRALGRGLTCREAGLKLGITEHTIKNHAVAIRRKLGTLTTAHAVIVAAERGLLNDGVTGVPADPWVAYFDAIETNLRRLRRDVNDVLAKVREAKRIHAAPEPVAVRRFTGDPARIVPTKGGRRVGDQCRKGHPFTEANTRLTAKGSRACRTCHAQYARERYRELVDRAARAA